MCKVTMKTFKRYCTRGTAEKRKQFIAGFKCTFRCFATKWWLLLWLLLFASNAVNRQKVQKFWKLLIALTWWQHIRHFFLGQTFPLGLCNTDQIISGFLFLKEENKKHRNADAPSRKPESWLSFTRSFGAERQTLPIYFITHRTFSLIVLSVVHSEGSDLLPPLMLTGHKTTS